MLPFPMARQSQPPSTAHHPRILHSRPSFRFVAPLPLMSYIQPFYNQPLPYSHVSRSACKPLRISNLRIHSVATGVWPYRKQNASSVFAHPWSTLGFSVACSLFQSLCPLFRATVFYFQQLTASFSKTPGVGGGPVLRTFVTASRCSVRSAPGVLCASAPQTDGAAT